MQGHAARGPTEVAHGGRPVAVCLSSFAGRCPGASPWRRHRHVVGAEDEPPSERRPPTDPAHTQPRHIGSASRPSVQCVPGSSSHAIPSLALARGADRPALLLLEGSTSSSRSSVSPRPSRPTHQHLRRPRPLLKQQQQLVISPDAVPSTAQRRPGPPRSALAAADTGSVGLHRRRQQLGRARELGRRRRRLDLGQEPLLRCPASDRLPPPAGQVARECACGWACARC